MSNQSESGTTAIQVSPADLTALIEFAERMVAVGNALRQSQEQVRNLSYDLDQKHYALQQCEQRAAHEAADNADLRNRLSLLETQNAGTETELRRTKDELFTTANKLVDAERVIDGWQGKYVDVVQSLEIARRERDDAQFQHLEVSEALAQANAKLDKFRELLGVNLGQPSPPVVESRPTPTEAPKPESVHVPEASSPVAQSVPLESNPVPTFGVGTGGFIQGSVEPKEDHQHEMPIKDERAADGPSAFPSPAPTVEPSPKPDGTEHGSSDHSRDPWDYTKTY